MDKIACFIVFLVFFSCAEENVSKPVDRIIELSAKTQNIDDLDIIGRRGSKLTVLEGINNYSFTGKGVITVTKNDLASKRIALNLGHIIISEGKIQIVSDSLINKIGVLEGNIQIQYLGRKADVSNGKTAYIIDNDLIIKSSIQK